MYHHILFLCLIRNPTLAGLFQWLLANDLTDIRVINDRFEAGAGADLLVFEFLLDV